MSRNNEFDKDKNSKPFPQAYLYPHQIEEIKRRNAANRTQVESKKPMRPAVDNRGNTYWVQD
jgi:hypothetical protein